LTSADDPVPYREQFGIEGMNHLIQDTVRVVAGPGRRPVGYGGAHTALSPR
jgi:hypothetical protein